MMESKPHILFPFQFQKEIKAGACEDAPPVATERYAIVCDGLGGAGHTKHTLPDEENPGAVTERTSAYLGSRIAADCVERFFREHWEDWAAANQALSMGEAVQQLKKELDGAIQRRVEEMHIPIPVGKTIKIFPTTLASAAFLPCEDGLTVAAVWAGDSRVYVLTPSKGLQLLSPDDAEGAAEAMNSGTVMTNCIYAGSYYLNYLVYTLRGEPGIVFCCSDGCFDYLRSPLHLEWLLLRTVLDAPQGDGNEPGACLAASIRDGIYQVIRDDTTMAGVCFGFSSLASLQEAFRPRMEDFEPMAVQMNGYIMEKNSAQDAVDQARKVRHLYEDEVLNALEHAVQETVIAQKPKNLYKALMGLEAFSEYGAWKAEGLRQLDSDFEKKEEELDTDIEKRNRQCRSLFVVDYIVDYMESQNRMPRRSILPGRGSKYVSTWETAPDAQSLDTVLATLIELTKLEEFWKAYPKFDWKMQQNPCNLLDMLRKRLAQEGEQYRPLLTRAYLSSDLFAEQRRELEEDKQFQNTYQELLKNPGACSFCSARTRKTVKSVQEAKCDKEDLQKEKQNRKRELAAQYCEKKKRRILEQLLEKPAEELKALFEKADVPMQKVLKLAEAQKTLRRDGGAGQPEQIEAKIQGLWVEYRKEYELFKRVERGRT